jgi:hypothetical protein
MTTSGRAGADSILGNLALIMLTVKTDDVA